MQQLLKIKSNTKELERVSNRLNLDPNDLLHMLNNPADMDIVTAYDLANLLHVSIDFLYLSINGDECV